MQTSLRCAITLFAGALFTMIWMAACPKYKLSGSVSSYEMVSDFSNVGHHTTDFEHTETAMFFGGEIVIWSVVAGVYHLIPVFTPMIKASFADVVKEVKTNDPV